MLFLLALPLLSVGALASRKLIIKNECSFEIWPAVLNTFSDGGYSGPRGWHAKPGSSKTVTVPEHWNGRAWARRGCSFDSKGKGSCLSGDCGGGLECEDATMGWANLFEVNLESYAGQDCATPFVSSFSLLTPRSVNPLLVWDISAVPGFNVPMSVVPGDSSCDAVVCSKDLLATCPKELRVYDSDGKTVINCLSACMADIYGIGGKFDNSMNCCAGQYNSLEKCVSSKVDYYE
ncbi:hypothetical protein JCM10213_008875 [Rhodosporidiobolus nylandii]